MRQRVADCMPYDAHRWRSDPVAVLGGRECVLCRRHESPGHQGPPNRPTMTALDLFAGAGGASIGLSWAGCEVVGHVERNADACATLRANGWHGVIGADIDDLTMREAVRPLQLALLAPLVPTLPKADLWCAGPPCQPFSNAGDREAGEDDRDGFPGLLKLAAVHRPTWLIVENVRGLLNHAKEHHPHPTKCPGCYFELVLEQLRTLFPVVEWRLLDAADFGVPQRRSRVIIVCGPSPIAWPLPTHSRESLDADKADDGPDGYWARIGRGDYGERLDRWEAPVDRPPFGLIPRAWRTMRQALKLPVEGKVVGGGTRPHGPDREHERVHRELTDEPSLTVACHDGSGVPFLETGQRTTSADGSRPLHRVPVDSPSPTMRSGNGTGPTLVHPAYVPFDGENHVDTDDEHAPWWHRASPPDDPSRAVGTKANASILLDQPSGTVLASDGAGALSKTSRLALGVRELLVDGPDLLDIPSPCVSATEVKGAAMSPTGERSNTGGLQRASDALQLGTSNARRRLTERECATIQGFPETYQFRGASAESVYRQIGNACPPALTAAVVRAVLSTVWSGDSDLFFRARAAGWEPDAEHKGDSGALLHGWQSSARMWLRNKGE